MIKRVCRYHGNDYNQWYSSPNMTHELISEESKWNIPKRGWLQTLFPILLLLISIWIAVGRMFLGSGGWAILITVFVTFPILVLYTIVVTTIISRRYSTSNYSFSAVMKIFIYSLLISGFIWGLTLIDSADTGGASSALLSQFGIDSTNNEGSLLWVINAILYFVSFFGFVGSAILVFIFSIIDNKQK